jgi:GNAT superfamily N-acetyltransferase
MMKKLFDIWMEHLKIIKDDFSDNLLRFKRKGTSDYIEKWYVEGKEILFFTENNEKRLNKEETFDFCSKEYFLHIEKDKLNNIDFGDYEVKQIDDSYKEQFDIFQSELTEGDKEAGFVELDHIAIFVALDKDKIVSASSIINYGPFKDIGVITHPAYRKKNLGAAVVKKATEWCFENDVIPLYRCEVKNIGSLNIAKKIGYEKYIEIDAYK